MSEKNPHHLCTWDESAPCEACINHDYLHCKWSSGPLLTFMTIILPTMLCHLLGTILIGGVTGAWWPMVAYIAFYPIFLGIFEIRFLCSHCPYYGEEGRVLHCLANHGALKIWKYNPGPMNKLEKALMYLTFLLILVILPGLIFGFNLWFFYINLAIYGNLVFILVGGLTIITIATEIGWLYVMNNYMCSKCVNFSCPFNRVSKERVDDYLKKNTTMRKAWKETGYKLG